MTSWKRVLQRNLIFQLKVKASRIMGVKIDLQETIFAGNNDSPAH